MISDWSAQRRARVFIYFFIAFLVLASIPVYLFFNQKPNCSNGKQDGDETGVDCGGSCQKLCTPEVLPIISRGDARLLKISPNQYEVVVVLQNPNANGFVKNAPYTFSIYSSTEQKPIKVVSGFTSINRDSEFAVFEGPFPIDATATPPLRVAFNWGNLNWQKDNTPIPNLSFSNIVASETEPRLEANITNNMNQDVSNIEVVSVFTNSDGNVVAAGKTFVDHLSPAESSLLVYTWPPSFSLSGVASRRLYAHVLPDPSYIH